MTTKRPYRQIQSHSEILEVGTSTYGIGTVQQITVTLINLHLFGYFQGSTSLEFIVWGASTECYVTTFVPMLKSSCSYLKSMHHIPSEIIPLEDWMSGVYVNSQGFNMIKVLPVRNLSSSSDMLLLCDQLAIRSQHFFPELLRTLQLFFNPHVILRI